jgi:hypothetical protein
MAGLQHNAKEVCILGVITNGGDQAVERAVLAKAILNSIGADIPVGHGTAGKPKAPGPLEYGIDGYDTVERGSLVDGAQLFEQVGTQPPILLP